MKSGFKRGCNALMSQPVSILVVFVLIAVAGSHWSVRVEAGCTTEQPPPYPNGSTYPGVHGNRENNERIPCNGPDDVRLVQSEGTGASSLEPPWLQGKMIVQSISISADGEKLFATVVHTERCKLYSVDTKTGEARCLQEDLVNFSDLTAGVSASSPEIDEEGFIYVTDGLEPDSASVSCYYPKGGRRWRTELKGLHSLGMRSGFATPMGLHFTHVYPAADGSPRGGYIATATAEGVIALLNRCDGRILTVLDIPLKTGFVPIEPGDARIERIPPGLKAKVESVIGNTDGLTISTNEFLSVPRGRSGAFSDNTLAISRDNTLFLTGGGPPSSKSPHYSTQGSLIAVRVMEGEKGPELVYLWTMHFEGGSGSSPTLDPLSRYVVVGDAENRLLCADIGLCNRNQDADPRPDVCEPAWTHQMEGQPLIGSVSMDEKAVVYAWNSSPEPETPDLVAVTADPENPGKSKVLWEKCLAQPGGPNAQWSSTALVLDNMVVGTVLTADKVVFVEGLPLPILLQGSHQLVALDRTDGEILWKKPIYDDSINCPIMGQDRSIYVPLVGMMDLMSPNPTIRFRGGIAAYRPF